MFGLISKKKFETLVNQYNAKVEYAIRLEDIISNYKNLDDQKDKLIKDNLETIENQKVVIAEKNKQLEKLETIEITKTISDFQLKEFGQESLTELKEACVEEVLEEVKSKITLDLDKSYNNHSIIAKLTIQTI